MATIDASIGGASANSYLSVADADTLLDENLYADAWTDADAATKTVALIHATRLIDAEFDWVGLRTTPATQRLDWPREYAGLIDGREISNSEIPREVQYGTAALALSLIQQSSLPETGAGLQNLELPGGLKLGFREDTVKSSDAIPEEVRRLVSPLVRSRTQPSGGGRRTVTRS